MNAVISTQTNIAKQLGSKQSSITKQIGKTLLYFFLVVFALLQIFPLLWVLSYSLQKTGDLFGQNFFTIPTHPVWNNYVRAWTDGKILTYTINSAIVVGSSVIISTFLAFCLAYATTRMTWKLRGIVYGFVTLGMVIPIHATLLPNFIWFNIFSLINTRIGVIIPYVTFTLSFNTLVFAALMQGLPKEMEESTDPLVRQFVHGLIEGPLTERRRADGYESDLLEGSV